MPVKKQGRWPGFVAALFGLHKQADNSHNTARMEIAMHFITLFYIVSMRMFSRVLYVVDRSAFYNRECNGTIDKSRAKCITIIIEQISIFR